MADSRWRNQAFTSLFVRNLAPPESTMIGNRVWRGLRVEGKCDVISHARNGDATSGAIFVAPLPLTRKPDLTHHKDSKQTPRHPACRHRRDIAVSYPECLTAVESDIRILTNQLGVWMDDDIDFIAARLMTFNSVINPLLYIAICKPYRKGCWVILRNIVHYLTCTSVKKMDMTLAEAVA
ncbi:hypothetical protein Bbelb_238230 [Branchiostoma belcheri]|nr:hypothetical protein Bbelb_238230 [Branchiostoma belcheri]